MLEQDIAVDVFANTRRWFFLALALGAGEQPLDGVAFAFPT